MKINFLNIGSETQKLSACRLSLMLGVHQKQDNRIKKILQFSCETLSVEQAIWVFEHEPYVWHYATELRAIPKGHARYAQPHSLMQGISSDYLQQLGFLHQRYVCVEIQSKSEVIGYVYFFDQHETAFSEKSLMLVKDYLCLAVDIIQLKEENSIFKELYEQQASLSLSKTKYFQILAHDLRAPFHGLLGFTDVLLHEHETLNHEEQHEIVEYLNHTAQAMYQLLESVLAWAMADGGRFIYNPIHFRVKEIVNIVFDVLAGLASKKGIRLINDIDEQLQIYADINMMTSVFQNLVSNALKFTQMDASGWVRLWSRSDGDHIHIYVQDTGLGMSKEQLDQVFEPILTMRPTGTDGEAGAGLGLVLCKRFMDLNLGQISVKSEEMKGTTFKLSLPSAISQITELDNLIKFKHLG